MYLCSKQPYAVKVYRVHNQPYYKLKIIATLIDYGIFFTIFWFYVSTFGVRNPDEDSYTVNGLPALVPPAFWLLYFVVLEATNQATPGHDICRLSVFTADGRKISFTQALKRRMCDPIDIFMWGIPAFICISKTPNHQRLGDLWAGTLVAKKSDLKEEEVIF